MFRQAEHHHSMIDPKSKDFGLEGFKGGKSTEYFCACYTLKHGWIRVLSIGNVQICICLMSILTFFFDIAISYSQKHTATQYKVTLKHEKTCSLPTWPPIFGQLFFKSCLCGWLKIDYNFGSCLLHENDEVPTPLTAFRRPNYWEAAIPSSTVSSTIFATGITRKNAKKKNSRNIYPPEV